MVNKKPRAGSRAWEEERRRDPAYVRATVLELAREADRGTKQAAEFLLGWLEQYPEMRSLVSQLDDLATRVERAWVLRLAGDDELARRALADDLAATKAELLGPAPSVTDKVLAGALLVAQFAFQRAALAATLPADSPEVRTARDKLLTAAQRRLHDAVRAWELYSGKKAKGLRPQGGLKLFEPDAAS